MKKATRRYETCENLANTPCSEATSFSVVSDGRNIQKLNKTKRRDLPHKQVHVHPRNNHVTTHEKLATTGGYPSHL